MSNSVDSDWLSLRVSELEDELTHQNEELINLRIQLEQTRARARYAEQITKEVRASTSWRITFPLRVIKRLLHSLIKAEATGKFWGLGRLRRVIEDAITEPALSRVLFSAEPQVGYREWVQQYDTINDEIRAQIGTHIRRMRDAPLISVAMSVYNTHLDYLEAAIESVKKQIYPNWQLCIADDFSTDPQVRKVLAAHATSDPRIKVLYRETNGGVCRATNTALTLAEGEFVAFLDHDDVLAEHALYCLASELQEYPEAEIIYSDSDNLDDTGARCRPFFKPEFDFDRVLGQNMVGHLCAYRRSLVQKVGGLRIGLEGAQDYDLLLRTIQHSTVKHVRHIPLILYHWRRPQQHPTLSMRRLEQCAKAGRTAVKEFLNRCGIAADVTAAPQAPFWQKVQYKLPTPAPTVSIIIPTKNKPELLERGVSTILSGTDYPSFQIVITDHESDDPDAKTLLSKLRKNDRITVLEHKGPFNYSLMNNTAARAATGTVLAFLNNDTEVIQASWLQEMVSHASRVDVGAVGAKLYYPNGTIQHAGIVLGIGGVAGHAYRFSAAEYAGIYGELVLTREVAAVTGACMVVRKSVFLEVDGFDETNLPVAFNDVDLCLRLRERGYRTIITPWAQLVHHESATRGANRSSDSREQYRRDFDYMQRRWGSALSQDSHFSRNFCLEFEQPTLARPPRVTYPWDRRPQ